MKKNWCLILVVSLSIFIVSCQRTVTHIPAKSEISSLDFTKYQEDNFLITPSSYGGDYESLGLVTYSMYAESDFVVSKENKDIGEWVHKKILVQDVLDLAYNKAKKQGANAITNFKLEATTKSVHDGLLMVSIPGISISGLLIKRK